STRRSDAPKAAEKAEPGPATVTCRAPGSAPVTLIPNRPSTLRINVRSAGSVPCADSSCSRLSVAGPVTYSAGRSSRRRVISVTSMRVDSSSCWALSSAPVSGVRSLPGSGTKEFSGMLGSPALLPACPRGCRNYGPCRLAATAIWAGLPDVPVPPVTGELARQVQRHGELEYVQAPVGVGGRTAPHADALTAARPKPPPGHHPSERFRRHPHRFIRLADAPSAPLAHGGGQATVLPARP